jgi:hypothetical protein
MKLGSRAARVGFDWTGRAGVLDKIEEEIDELQGRSQADTAAVHEELGDLLFSLAQAARHLGVDAEAALRAPTRNSNVASVTWRPRSRRRAAPRAKSTWTTNWSAVARPSRSRLSMVDRARDRCAFSRALRALLSSSCAARPPRFAATLDRLARKPAAQTRELAASRNPGQGSRLRRSPAGAHRSRPVVYDETLPVHAAPRRHRARSRAPRS